jgi:aspartyl-tRNA(Asn)/glutamyl-tRNA(Gln) amidotransferase subunit A
VRRILSASKSTAVDLTILLRERKRLIAEVAARIGDALLICPTTPTVAMQIAPLEADQEVFFRHNGLTLRNTSLGNFLDWCGLSIPNGRDADQMPTGFMISAPHGRDRAVLAAGLAIEQIVRG